MLSYIILPTHLFPLIQLLGCLLKFWCLSLWICITFSGSMLTWVCNESFVVHCSISLLSYVHHRCCHCDIWLFNKVKSMHVHLMDHMLMYTFHIFPCGYLRVMYLQCLHCQHGVTPDTGIDTGAERVVQKQHQIQRSPPYCGMFHVSLVCTRQVSK